jgi:sugar lactone lactonase YvrE
VVNSAGQVTRVITVAAGHALLGELFVNGQIYVADNNGDFSGGRVDRVDVATGAVTVVASGFANTNAFERDANGILYVSDSFRGAVYTVNPTTGATAEWKQSELLRSHGFPGFGANGLAFDASRSNLYVANTGDDRIFRIAVNPDGSAGALSIFADGAAIDAAHHTTGALDGADGIVFDAAGRLWVCANQADEVQVLAPSGTNLVKRLRGTGDNAMHFPASPVFVGHAMFVTNLYFGTPGAGKISAMGAAPGAP